MLYLSRLQLRLLCICCIAIGSVIEVLLKDGIEVISIYIELSPRLVHLNTLSIEAIGIGCRKVAGRLYSRGEKEPQCLQLRSVGTLHSSIE